MIKTYKALSLSLIALGLSLSLSACSSNKSDSTTKLEGERISVLTLQKQLEPANAKLEAHGLVAPAAWRNDYWPQAGGYPNHSMQNLELAASPLKLQWKAKIGKGSSKELPLTAQPIITKDKVFTLDSHAELTAFDVQSGKRIWDIYTGDEIEDDDNVITGGISFSAGVVYVTAGYDEVLAVNASDGSVIWRADIGTPSRAAPTVIEKRLYVTTIDNRMIAINAKDGTILWEYAGITEIAGLVGSASPAAGSNIVIPAFSSGEIVALRAENGSVLWSDNLSSLRSTGGLTSISDIKAPPVIDKGIVVAMNFSGRLVAIDERTGNRIWQKEIGGSNMPWMAGNHLFVLSHDNNLVALGRKDGTIRWVTALPSYKKPEKKKGPIQWTGPILAGSRLIVVNSVGEIADVDPNTGEMTNAHKVGKSFYIPPVIAGATLYLLAEDGTLSAYE